MIICWLLLAFVDSRIAKVKIKIEKVALEEMLTKLDSYQQIRHELTNITKSYYDLVDAHNQLYERVTDESIAEEDEAESEPEPPPRRRRKRKPKPNTAPTIFERLKNEDAEGKS